MMLPEQLGRNLFESNWGIKFMAWLGMIPFIFLLEFLLIKATIKGRNEIAAHLKSGKEPAFYMLGPQLGVWEAEIYSKWLMIGFANLTAEVFEGPRR